ncbi:BREX system ATP-binding domain-containing protein [Nonomuraea sp. NPDC052129]|uniref:BREX system ATP-binding domain-containing protein n=1 Tax=Nonomuraea sp. NPDC052129 TaxID=3154651 RepID=UPI0034432852
MSPGVAVAGSLGGKVGVAPRVFLKKLVGDVLDRVDQFADFDPRVHYQLTVGTGDLNEIERNAVSADALSGGCVDDIKLELS